MRIRFQKILNRQSRHFIKNITQSGHRTGSDCTGFIRKTAVLFMILPALNLAACYQPPRLSKQTYTFELGADVYANPDVYVENPDEINPDKIEILALTPGIAKLNNRFVSTGSEYLAVGEYDFMMKNGSQEYPFNVKIKDTQPPKPSKSPDSLEIPLGSAVDWASVYEASDLSEVYYEAPMDVSSNAGEQDITVKISDRFGNAVEKSLHVVVTP